METRLQTFGRIEPGAASSPLLTLAAPCVLHEVADDRFGEAAPQR